MAVETKLRIPHLNGQDLVGILCEPEGRTTRGGPIALILHGQLAHKDQIYHRALAKRLAQDGQPSFRFDFRSNHESLGDWRLDDFDADILDLERVLDFLDVEYGYRLHLLIGHSRGSIVSFRYLCLRNQAVPLFVNVSGRYDFARMRERWNGPWGEAFRKQGYFDWHAKVAGEKVVKRVRPDDLERFAAYDTSFVEQSFPQHTHVLTVHGDADETVPIEDAHEWDRILSNRSPGTHTLAVVPGAGHNFKGLNDEVAKIIADWVLTVSPPAWTISPCEPDRSKL